MSGVEEKRKESGDNWIHIDGWKKIRAEEQSTLEVLAHGEKFQELY